MALSLENICGTFRGRGKNSIFCKLFSSELRLKIFEQNEFICFHFNSTQLSVSKQNVFDALAHPAVLEAKKKGIFIKQDIVFEDFVLNVLSHHVNNGRPSYKIAMVLDENEQLTEINIERHCKSWSERYSNSKGVKKIFFATHLKHYTPTCIQSSVQSQQSDNIKFNF